MKSIHFNRRTFTTASALLLAAAACTFLPAEARAQAAFPSRPITLIVPFAPGGADAIAREVGIKLQARLGQPVVIDNRAGAGGAIGASAVAKAPADGYTLLFTTTAIATNAAMGTKLPFDTQKDFTPIGVIAASPLLIVGTNNSPVKNLRELLDSARAKPRSVNYGANGVGSISHIGMELLAAESKVQLVNVPYKGTSAAMGDLMSGQIQAALTSFSTSWPLVESGKLRALAVTGPQRVSIAPNIPTVAESGVPGAQIEFWWGIMGPAKMPPDVVKRLNTELNAVLAQPEVRQMLAQQEATARPGPPEAFGKLMSFEITRWSKLIKDNNIKVE